MRRAVISSSSSRKEESKFFFSHQAKHKNKTQMRERTRAERGEQGLSIRAKKGREGSRGGEGVRCCPRKVHNKVVVRTYM